MLLGLFIVPPELGRGGWGRPGSLGGRATIGTGELEVGLWVAALDRPCELLPAYEEGFMVLV